MRKQEINIRRIVFDEIATILAEEIVADITRARIRLWPYAALYNLANHIRENSR